MIRKYPNTVANQREMLEAGQKLVEYMDICHDNPVAHSIGSAALDGCVQAALGFDGSSGGCLR